MTLETATWVAAGVLVVLLVPALIYLIGSFSLMFASVSVWPGQSHAASMARELYYVLITQPLIPLYFFVGRTFGGGDGTPVIFVHGYFQNRADFWWMARQFRTASAGPLYGFNYPWWETVDRNIPRLGRFIDRVCAETGAEKVDLVAHSLGGLVCLEYSHSPAGMSRVAHCVTIGTPHDGVRWRGPILGKVGDELRGGQFAAARRNRTVISPTLSVYSTHDNIVYPPSTSRLSDRGGNDVAVEGLGHLSLLYSPEVTRVVMDFIGGKAP